MASSYGEDIMNTSVVDTSAIQGGDFEMFLDCLEELCKTNTDDKKRKSKKHKRPKTGKISQQKQNYSNISELFQTMELNDKFEENAIDSTFSTVNTSQWSANDTAMSANSEKYTNIFAYFDQDATTDELLLSDNSFDEQNNYCDQSQSLPICVVTNDATESNYLKNSKKNSSNIQTKEIQTKSKSILSKIQQFNRIEPKPEIIKQKTPSKIAPKLDKVPSLSSLHGSDNEFVFKKPYDVVDNGNVKRKVVFFSDHSSTERSSSESPSTQSCSDDETIQFQRSQSKRKFHQNRDFFEKYFNGKTDANRVKSLPSTSTSTSSLDKIDETTSMFIDSRLCKQNDMHASDIDPNEKLQAVQTYVQTKNLLERIQRLVVAITSLDEKRLNSMNLKLLKKFLTFIRDCSYKCTEVCNEISGNFLTDFEKNVMSAEELLFSALRMAQQVY